MKSEDVELDNPYCFTPALEEGFFSDVVIKSKSGREVCRYPWNIWYLLKPIKKISTTAIDLMWKFLYFFFFIQTFFKIRSYAVQLSGEFFLLQFKLHSILLDLAVPGHDWRLSTLNGMPDNILSTVFHYLYKECLPPGLSEDTARDCIKTLTDMKEFDTFTNLCQTFLRNTALRHR